MTKFFNKFKKPCFWPIFGQFLTQKYFSGKSGCHAQLHMGFQYHAKIQKKTNHKTPRQAKGQKDRQKDTRKDDRPDFKGPFQLLPWVQQYTIQNNIVHRGINPPFENTTPLSCKAPSPRPPPHLKTVQAAPLQAIPPIFWFFVNPPPPLEFFRELHKYKSFLSFTSSYLLKVTKCLVKISQFEFLFMTKQNILVYL